MMKENEEVNLACNPATLQPCNLLLIACGNLLRGDDGAGIELAKRVCTAWREAGVAVELIEVQQLTPELVVPMARAGVTRIVFFDTRLPTAIEECQSGPFREGAVSSRKVGDSIGAVEFHPLAPADTAALFGHQLQPETLLLYLQKLYHLSPPAWLVTIPGQTFEHGAEFSTAVKQMVATAPLLARKLLGQVHKTLQRTKDSNGSFRDTHSIGIERCPY